MKILYLLNEFPLVTENFIFYEVGGFIKRGADVKIFSIATVPKEKQSNVPKELGFEHLATFRGPLSTHKFMRLWRTCFLLFRLLVKGKVSAVMRLLKDGQTSAEFSRYIMLDTAYQIEKAHDTPDIIHCHFGPVGRFAAVLKHYGLIDAKIVTIFHGYDISSYIKDRPKNVYDTLFKQGDFFICVSDFFLQRLRELGAPEEKSATIHTAIDCTDFEFIPRMVPDEGPLRFICVGRLTEKKGHKFLIEAFSKLCQSHTDQSFHLDLIGGGELTEEVTALVAEHNLQNAITIHGAIQHGHVRDLLKKAHVFVLHSVTSASGDTEGIPCSIMEAMAQGLPVISTFHTGIPELVEHGVSGLLSAEKDVEELYVQMKTLVKTPEIWADMTRKARVKVEAEFEREVVSDQLFELFKRLAA